MKIKFDMIRIGSKRKNVSSEIILKENVEILKKSIRSFFKGENCSHKNNEEHITMIIPAKGDNIKVLIQDFKDYQIRQMFRESFSDFIYKGNLDKLPDYYDNKIF